MTFNNVLAVLYIDDESQAGLSMIIDSNLKLHLITTLCAAVLSKPWHLLLCSNMQGLVKLILLMLISSSAFCRGENSVFRFGKTLTSSPPLWVFSFLWLCQNLICAWRVFELCKWKPFSYCCSGSDLVLLGGSGPHEGNIIVDGKPVLINHLTWV